MHAFLIVIRCQQQDIPVTLYQSLREAMGAACQLAQAIRDNYTVLHTYASRVAATPTNPLCVSIYEFVSNELKLVVGSYLIEPDHYPRLAA